MTLRRTLHRLALGAERAIDRRIARRGRERPIIEPYGGYATPEHLIARARVLTALRRGEPLPTQSRWANFKQMAALFLTGEVEGVRVLAGGTEAVSDAEGYVSLLIPRNGQGPGWHEVEAHCEGFAEEKPLPILVPRPDAAFGVISDIDDTLIHTGAYSLMRNLWNSLTGNALTREVFADAVELMRLWHEGGRNPVFYVSSSPWNLHHFLETIFAGADLPRGPKFLRDYGLSETSVIAEGHGGHKGSAIDVILEANPGLPFRLLGDTGQHDAEVYREAAARHPGRITHVALRRPRPDWLRADPASRSAMEALRQMGVEVYSGRDFADLVPGA